MRVVYLGTRGPLAIRPFEAILASGHEVLGVIIPVGSGDAGIVLGASDLSCTLGASLVGSLVASEPRIHRRQTGNSGLPSSEAFRLGGNSRSRGP